MNLERLSLAVDMHTTYAHTENDLIISTPNVRERRRTAPAVLVHRPNRGKDAYRRHSRNLRQRLQESGW